MVFLPHAQNEKYLVLRPAFKYPSKNQEAVDYNEPKAVIVHEKSPVDSAIIKDDGRSLEKLRQDAQVVSSSETTDMTVETVAKDKNKSGIGGETLKETEYMETSDHHITTPVAPPRRKHSEKEKKSVPSLEINSQKVNYL